MWIQVPAPIQLRDERTGEPLKVPGKIIDSQRVEVREHTAESLHEFARDHLAAQASTFEEQRIWVEILSKLDKAEQDRARGVEPWVELKDNEYKKLREKMEKLQLSGVMLRQFMPFMNAVEDAKREKPVALKSVDTTPALPPSAA